MSPHKRRDGDFMTDLFSLPFIFLHISTFLTFILLLLITRIKNKKSLHIFSLLCVFLIFSWCLTALVEQYFVQLFGYNGIIFNNITITITSFLPVSLFYFGYVYAHSTTFKKYNLFFLFIFPIISTILIWTDKYHHLFFTYFSHIDSEVVNGPYLLFFHLYAYIMDVFGLYFLIRFSIKNSGFFSKQSILIVAGTIFPLAVDVAFVLNIFQFPLYFEPISFSIAVICYMIAILKFDFLNIVPVALQTVVDHISDSYLVLNERLEVTDYNKPFINTFSSIIAIKRKVTIGEIFNNNTGLSVQTDDIIQSVVNAVENQKPFSFEKHIFQGAFDRYFVIEITPIISNGSIICVLVLFKDMTAHKKAADLISKTQTQLLEKERLASLGQLVAGIAHNLKTPIMSVAGGLEGLTDLIDEYNNSIGDKSVTNEDHYEIAEEMRQWITKMKNYCSYMSDLITTVKGQTVQLTASTTDKFLLRELLKRVDILMNHELKRYCCKLNLNCSVDMEIEIKGDINSLVQVLNNLIINAIEAYEGKEGEIDLYISNDDHMVSFVVKDYGCGMTKDVKNKLFKEMITTKAKNGTGLGLYMSFSTIMGLFAGKMWFESEPGKGTEFYILVPSV